MRFDTFIKIFIGMFVVSAVVGVALYGLIIGILWKVFTGMDAPHHAP